MYDIINKAMCDIDKNTRNWIEKVYRQGYEDGQKEKLANAMIYDHEVAEKMTYEQGLNDAWECAEKITYMNPDERVNIFGISNNSYGNQCDVFLELSAFEAINKIKEYESKQNNKEEDIKDEMTVPKMLDVLEHVFTCPSELYDRDSAMNRIMEAYRELRKKNIKRVMNK